MAGNAQRQHCSMLEGRHECASRGASLSHTCRDGQAEGGAQVGRYAAHRPIRQQIQREPLGKRRRQQLAS